MKQSNKSSGFTLAEVLIVIFIIGILAAIAIPSLLNQIEKARDVQIQSDLRKLAIDLQEYAAHYGYPNDANPGVEPVPEITFPVEPGRTIDYDRFCVGNVRWVKILSYPANGRIDDYQKPGAIGEWTRTGKDWARTLWVGKC